jgi:hypothetical protein
VDDEDGHIWLGGDNVIHHRAVLAQVFSVRGYEWIEIMRLREVSQ